MFECPQCRGTFVCWDDRARAYLCLGKKCGYWTRSMDGKQGGPSMCDRYVVEESFDTQGWRIKDEDANGACVQFVSSKNNGKFVTFYDREDAENFAAALNLGQASRNAKTEQGVGMNESTLEVHKLCLDRETQEAIDAL